jgi:hypothetical protein
MSDWLTGLREADAARVQPLAPQAAQRIRRTAVAAAENADAAPRLTWPAPFVLTIASLTLVCAALLALLQMDPAGAMEPVLPAAVRPEAAIADAPGGGRQLLHFATPGGTRIIWVFDADFEVKGTLP